MAMVTELPAFPGDWRQDRDSVFRGIFPPFSGQDLDRELLQIFSGEAQRSLPRSGQGILGNVSAPAVSRSLQEFSRKVLEYFPPGSRQGLGENICQTSSRVPAEILKGIIYKNSSIFCVKIRTGNRAESSRQIGARILTPNFAINSRHFPVTILTGKTRKFSNAASAQVVA